MAGRFGMSIDEIMEEREPLAEIQAQSGQASSLEEFMKKLAKRNTLDQSIEREMEKEGNLNDDRISCHTYVKVLYSSLQVFN